MRDVSSIQLYERFYCEYDEWTLRLPKRVIPGKIIQGQELLPKSALLKSLFYNEFLKKVETCQMACLTKHFLQVPDELNDLGIRFL